MQRIARNVLTAFLLFVAGAAAQTATRPVPAPRSPAIEEPRDIPFAGEIALTVDATDTAHKIFAVRESIPVQQAGEVVLLYPQWDGGSHAPTGSVASLAGLVVHAGSARLEWRRDPVNVFAFHIAVPKSVRALDVDFQYISPIAPRAGAMVMTRDIVLVQWQNLVVYPAGWFARNVRVKATLVLPAGFQLASALDPGQSDQHGTSFETTSLEALVDSPVYAGRYFSRTRLTDGRTPRVTLDVVADTPSDLVIAGVEVAKLRQMTEQVLRVFESRHYAHYDLLVSLSDILPSSGGVEHLESGEVNLPANFFREGEQHLLDQSLVAHEYVHSWNGLFRQPADLWTPTLNVPMRDSLLWVYEGQTEFWARVVAVRTGMVTREQALDLLAMDAATAQTRVGRAWKSLEDSNNDPLFEAGHAVAWRDWQRREDYYGEGVLLWLGVDALIRERTAGKRSLEDFAHKFFGIHDGDRVTMTYTFQDVCDALNRTAPYDWAAYLRSRLTTSNADEVLDGLTRAGYRLIYTATPTESFRQNEAENGVDADLSYSIGLSVAKTGVVKTVAWNGPAFRGGLAVGVQITAVDKKPFNIDGLRAAVARDNALPFEVTFRQDGQEHTARIDYRGGLRYPHLERIAGATNFLRALFSPNRK